MCEQCLGQGCPNCWPDYVECERCEGTGRIHYLIEPDTGEWIECSEDEYNKAADEYREHTPCPKCDGKGEYRPW